MKRIEDIEKLSAKDLLHIGDDESIPVPEDLRVRLPKRKRNWSIAAATALLIGLGGWGLGRAATPKDTFEDPYLAYAAVEKALGKMAVTVHDAAGKVNQAENRFNEITYWK